MGIRNWDHRLKRLGDVIAATLGLIVISPLLLITAGLVKLSSPGPVFFRHRRLGRLGEPFPMLKFRTMTVGCTGPEFTVAEDPRVTRIGRVLRKTKLDELPQLFNVLRGEMSLVGPRPQSLSLAEHYPLRDLQEILSVRPGVTGPTQLWLRHEEQLLADQLDPARYYVEELLPVKIASDINYVRRRNLVGDVRLVALTVKAVAHLAPQKTAEILDLRPIFTRAESPDLQKAA